MAEDEDISSDDLDAEIDQLTEFKDKVEKEHKEMIAEVDEVAQDGGKIASQIKELQQVRKQRA